MLPVDEEWAIIVANVGIIYRPYFRLSFVGPIKIAALVVQLEANSGSPRNFVRSVSKVDDIQLIAVATRPAAARRMCGNGIECYTEPSHRLPVIKRQSSQ